MGHGEAFDRSVGRDCGAVRHISSRVRASAHHAPNWSRGQYSAALYAACAVLFVVGVVLDRGLKKKIRVVERFSAPRTWAGRFTGEPARHRTDGSAAKKDGAASMTSGSSPDSPQRRTEPLVDGTGQVGSAGDSASGDPTRNASKEDVEAKPAIPRWMGIPRFRTLLPIYVVVVVLYRRVLVPYLGEQGVSRGQFYIWFFVILGVVALIGLPIEHKLRKKYGLTSPRGIKERIAAARQALRW